MHTLNIVIFNYKSGASPSFCFLIHFVLRMYNCITCVISNPYSNLSGVKNSSYTRIYTTFKPSAFNFLFPIFFK